LYLGDRGAGNSDGAGDRAHLQGDIGPGFLARAQDHAFGEIGLEAMRRDLQVIDP